MKSTKEKKVEKLSREQLEKRTSYDYECFERHRQYMEKKGYESCIPEWWAMYEGRQTPANYDPELPRATENITAWVIDSQHATLLGTTVSLNFTCFSCLHYTQRSLTRYFSPHFTTKTIIKLTTKKLG